MASIKKHRNKSGKVFYEIRCHNGRGNSIHSTRWYPPEGWSQKSIDRKLAKVAAEFERQCMLGNVLSRKEKAMKEAQKAAEAAQILTFRQYTEQVYLPAKAVNCSQNTISSFRGNLKNHLYPSLGDLKMPDITSAQLTAALLNFQKLNKTHATVVKLYTVLKSVFKMAYLADVVDRNPMEKVERPKPRKDEVINGHGEAFTVEEIRKIFQYLEDEPLKWQFFIRLMADTGIRRGECCGLQWSDFDTENSTVTIQRTVNYTPSTGIYVSTTKNRCVRTIDIDPRLLVMAEQYRTQQDFPSKWVFTQDDRPDPIFPTSPTQYMAKFSKRYGVEHFHPHKLRHTFASISITHGADVASISEKLGHSDKAVTLKMYTHSDQESMKRASQIFRDALDGKGKKKTNKKKPKKGKKKKDHPEKE